MNNIEHMKDEDLLTSLEVASILRISPLTLTRWRNKDPDLIPCFKVGRRYLYKVSEVKKYIESIQV